MNRNESPLLRFLFVSELSVRHNPYCSVFLVYLIANVEWKIACLPECSDSGLVYWLIAFVLRSLFFSYGFNLSSCFFPNCFFQINLYESGESCELIRFSLQLRHARMEFQDRSRNHLVSSAKLYARAHYSLRITLQHKKSATAPP